MKRRTLALLAVLTQKSPWVAVVAAFSISGIIFLTISHAATSVMSAEVENGAITAPATKVPDTAASGGSAIAFGNSPTGMRNMYQWPFSWDSIWNLPISKSAQYVPAGITEDPKANVNRGMAVAACPKNGRGAARLRRLCRR